MIFLYSFSVWPAEEWQHHQAIFELFGMYGRVELNFTEKGFEIFRSKLSHVGFTLREIERVPFVEPETIL